MAYPAPKTRPQAAAGQSNSNKSAKTEPITTGKAILLYPKLFTPDEFGTEPKYTVTLAFKKATQQAEIKKLHDKILEAAVASFGPSALKDGKLNGVASPLHDGDAKAQESGNEAFAGSYYIKATSKASFGAPAVLGPDKAPMIDPEACYSGCLGHANIVFRTYVYMGKKGVGCYLNAVLVVDSTQPRIGGSRGDGAFDDIDTGVPSATGDTGTDPMFG